LPETAHAALSVALTRGYRVTLRLAVPHAGGLYMGTRVPVGKASPAILASIYGDGFRRIEIDDDHMRQLVRGATGGPTGIDHHAVVRMADPDADLHPLACLGHAVERAVDLWAAGAIDMDPTVDDRLRRANGPVVECAHIFELALGVLLARKRIPPTQIVPVIDMIGERDQIRLRGKLGKQFVRRRTGIAS